MNTIGFDPKHLKGSETPWVPFEPDNAQVGIKLLHVDPVRGEMLLLMRVPAGTSSAWRWPDASFRREA